MIPHMGKAEEVLHRNLVALFAKSSLDTLFPDSQLPAPRVDDSDPKEIENAHVWIHERRGFASDGQTTGTLIRSGYESVIGISVTAHDAKTAKERIDRYIEVAFQAALADPTLGSTCDETVRPAILDLAQAETDGKWTYQAAISYSLARAWAAASDAKAIIASAG